MSNKDEALRARDEAEDWMSKEDFTTARRFAMKAQEMDASLENVVRMIMICDVHCAALEKSGGETDWYKILQVEQNADDNTITKQFRKLALHLHPDKNKFPGAESAFRTIKEAQRVLLDKDKRRLHDHRRKPAPAPSFRKRKRKTDESQNSNKTDARFDIIAKQSSIYSLFLGVKDFIARQFLLREVTKIKIHHPDGKRSWDVEYLPGRHCLSKGWTHVYKAYEVKDGDILTFSVKKKNELRLIITKPN